MERVGCHLGLSLGHLCKEERCPETLVRYHLLISSGNLPFRYDMQICVYASPLSLDSLSFQFEYSYGYDGANVNLLSLSCIQHK